MRTFSWPTGLALVATVSLLGGCGKQGNQTNTTVTLAPPVVAAGPPPSEEEYREFGKQLETAVATGDQPTVERLFRLDSLMERCVSDLGFSDSFRRGVITGFKRKSGELSKQIITETQNGGRYSSLGIRTVDGQPRLLMRLVADSGLNYHQFTLARYPDGTVAAEDFYIMLTGEAMSQTFRRILLKAAADGNQGLLSKLKANEQAFAKHLPSIQSMAQDVKQNRHKTALATYHQLPSELQKEKVVLIAALQAAQGVSDDEYLKVLESFRQTFPNDPSLDLVSVDYYLLKKQYNDSLQSIDRLDKSLGGDPYLHVIRGNVLAEAGRNAESKVALDKALEHDPKFENAYWVRIGLALKEANHAETLTWLKKIVTQCDVELSEEAMKKDDSYAKFLKSPQCKDFWKWYEMQEK